MKLFISYSSRDRDVANLVKQSLEAAGYIAWIDHVSIQGGKLWFAEIARAIHNCDICILLVSPDSVESKFVLDEVALAREKKKIVIPLIIRSTRIPRDMELLLAGRQHIVTTDDFDTGIERLHQTLKTFAAEKYRSRFYGVWAVEIFHKPTAVGSSGTFRFTRDDIFEGVLQTSDSVLEFSGKWEASDKSLRITSTYNVDTTEFKWDLSLELQKITNSEVLAITGTERLKMTRLEALS
jgi:hypothetical protein